MNSETLQALRAEIEAVATLQSALNRIALSVDENALSMWDGPRPEDADDVAADDGSFSRPAVLELRNRAAIALAKRYREVEAVVLGRAALEALLKETLVTGTGGVIAGDGPPAADVLEALARSGALRLDWAAAAAALVREVLEERAAAKAEPMLTPPEPTRARKPEKPAPAKKPAAKKAPAKKPAAKKAPAQKPAAKKAPAKKPAAKKAPAKKPAAKKTPAKKPAKRRG
jgi:hypothetical protein